jgi:copper chaperone CopZ
MATVTFTIQNISCMHCVHTIQNEVWELSGVKSVEASQNTRTVTIDFEAPATEEKIKELLAEINYPAA